MWSVRGYVYDGAGNRTSNGNSAYTSPYAPEGENHYQGMGYDANGNTVTPNDGWTYNYNAENQLVAAAGPNGQALSFGYDGMGRLVADNVNGVPKVYYHAGSQRIEEWNNSTQAVLARYFFDGPGSDAIFLCVDAQRGYRWYLYDAQGNTTHLCDNNGNVVEMYLYDAAGQPTVYDPYGAVRAGGSAYDNRYLFKGAAAYQWYAPASVYYCRARFYEPQHGRWLQPDPIGQAGGLNIYTYCHNDPVNGVDPSGLSGSDNLQEHLPRRGALDTSTGTHIPNYGSLQGINYYVNSPAGSTGYLGFGSGTNKIGQIPDNGPTSGGSTVYIALVVHIPDPAEVDPNNPNQAPPEKIVIDGSADNSQTVQVAVQIGMGRLTNPFGHAAIAIAGQGVWSFGTGTKPGSSFSKYLSQQAKYRDSMVYVTSVTSTQAQAMVKSLSSQPASLPSVPGPDSFDNCSSRSSCALNVGSTAPSVSTPAALQREMISRGALQFSVPTGSSPSDAWQIFDPQ